MSVQLTLDGSIRCQAVDTTGNRHPVRCPDPAVAVVDITSDFGLLVEDRCQRHLDRTLTRFADFERITVVVSPL